MVLWPGRDACALALPDPPMSRWFRLFDAEADELPGPVAVPASLPGPSLPEPFSPARRSAFFDPVMVVGLHLMRRRRSMSVRVICRCSSGKFRRTKLRTCGLVPAGDGPYAFDDRMMVRRKAMEAAAEWIIIERHCGALRTAGIGNADG